VWRSMGRAEYFDTVVAIYMIVTTITIVYRSIIGVTIIIIINIACHQIRLIYKRGSLYRGVTEGRGSVLGNWPLIERVGVTWMLRVSRRNTVGIRSPISIRSQKPDGGGFPSFI
jgi:hypothetical protein